MGEKRAQRGGDSSHGLLCGRTRVLTPEAQVCFLWFPPVHWERGLCGWDFEDLNAFPG